MTVRTIRTRNRNSSPLVFVLASALATLLVFASSVHADPGAVKPARVAILPFELHASKDMAYLRDGIRDMLASRLSARGGITVIDKAGILAALDGGQEPLEDRSLLDLGARLEADYLIAGSCTALGGGVSLDAKVFAMGGTASPERFFATAPREGEVIAAIDLLAWDIAEKVFGIARPAPPAEVAAAASGSSAAPVVTEHPDRSLRREGGGQGSFLLMPGGLSGAQGFTKSQNLQMALQAMAVGDVDGDGNVEVVLADANNVYIYRRQNSRLTLFWTIPGLARHRIHAVNLADLNENGRAEIYVSAADGFEPNSYAAEWLEKDFRYIFQDASWFVRPLLLPGEGLVLAGQRARAAASDPTSPDLGRSLIAGIYRLTLDGGSLRAGLEIEVPAGVNLFDFAISDLDGDGRAELMAIDQSDRLNVFRADGRKLWQSADHFGGTKRFIGGSTKEFANKPDSTAEENRYYVPSRLIVADVNGDNTADLLVNRNPPSASRMLRNLKSYPTGSLEALGWNGLALAELWRTKPIDGYVVDYELLPNSEGTGAELAVGLVLPSSWLDMMSTGECTVLFFEVEYPDVKKE